MPLIDSALAFAITMLALSLTCSAFIELIHRAFKMREAGLKYMLRQMFDQVLRKYAKPLAAKELSKTGPDAAKDLEDAYERVRERFVKLMTVNRAPIGLAADPALKAAPSSNAEGTDNSATKATSEPDFQLGNIWGGRSITQLTPIEFMERLGSTEVGKEIKAAAAAAGKDAADAEAKTDAVLKDIALKFDAFGKDAATYFEGRARFLSVAVAVALAFAIHVDAIDLFKTYLQNPNATASVIAQSQAVTDQMKSAQAAVEASKKLAAAAAPDDLKKPAEPAQPAVPSQPAKTSPDAAPNTASSDNTKKQLEELQQAADKAISDAKKMIKQFTDLGVPFGWSDARIAAADMWILVWTCKEPKPTSWLRTLGQKCEDDVPKHDGLQLQYKNVWFGIPMTLNVWFCLLLGGFLIGLGAPFWYDAVTGLANISKVLGGGSGTGGAPAPAAGTPQPITPASAFNVSSAAAETGAAAANNAGTPAAP
jgi:hypothetical protein